MCKSTPPEARSSVSSLRGLMPRSKVKRWQPVARPFTPLPTATRAADTRDEAALDDWADDGGRDSRED